MKNKVLIFSIIGALILALGISLFLVFFRSTPNDPTEPSVPEEVVQTPVELPTVEKPITDPDISPEIPTEEEIDELTSDDSDEDDDDIEDDSVVMPTIDPAQQVLNSNDAKRARIDELIAKVYSLRDYYMQKLSNIETDGLSEYYALSPSGRNTSSQKRIALACADSAYALEAECDAVMDEICKEIGFLLIELDSDMQLLHDIKYTYAATKSSVKNAYINKYSQYLS